MAKTIKLTPCAPGFRRVGAASCWLRVPTGIPEHMRADIREVYNLRTEPGQRNKGYATTLMHRVCREADQAGKLLMLNPAAYDQSEGHLSDIELQQWYIVRFGFQKFQDQPVLLLARMPGATPKVGLRLLPTTVAAIEAVKNVR